MFTIIDDNLIIGRNFLLHLIIFDQLKCFQFLYRNCAFKSKRKLRLRYRDKRLNFTKNKNTWFEPYYPLFFLFLLVLRHGFLSGAPVFMKYRICVSSNVGPLYRKIQYCQLRLFFSKLPILLSNILLVHRYFWKFCHNKINIFSFASMKIVGNTVYMPTCVSACFVEAEKFNFATHRNCRRCCHISSWILLSSDAKIKSQGENIFLFSLLSPFLSYWMSTIFL